MYVPAQHGLLLKHQLLLLHACFNLLLENVSSYYRMCPLTTECVLLLQNVSSYYRMCPLNTECVLFSSTCATWPPAETPAALAARVLQSACAAAGPTGHSPDTPV